MKTIAHLDMDAFFAAVEQRDNPALLGKPVIVGADPKEGKGRGVVATCSYEARAYGIHSAMPISQAYRLCPRGVFVRGRMRVYKEVSQKVFRILYDFTPDIEPVSIDEAFFDLTESFHLHQTPLKACYRIKERIKKELDLNASIGIAPNKMTAKIASDFCKPDGLLEIKPEELMDFLWKLPVERLWGVGKKMQVSLHQMGIKGVRDLANYPEEKLRARFGEQGKKLSELAHGIDTRQVKNIPDEIKSVSHEHTFEIDTKDKGEVYRMLSLLSEKVSRRLRKLRLKGRTITIKIRLDNFQTVTRAKTLSERVNFFEDIYQQARDLFDGFYSQGMKVRLIGIGMSNFHDPYLQDHLFEDKQVVKKEKVHAALDLIKDKFGEQAIYRAGKGKGTYIKTIT